MTTHGIDRSDAPAAAAAAAAAASPGTSTADASVVQGPGSSTDHAIARWDGATGRLIQNSVGILSDAGALSGITTLDVSGQITSTLTTGTAPLVIASTTVVANLNADLLDGAEGSAYLLIANIDDTPVNGETSAPISSNWAYDHENAADPHTQYVLTSEIGSAVQAYDADLAAIAALAVTDGNIIVGNGSTWVAESGATARTSLGLGTGDSPQFTSVNIGHASDTTLTRVAAGVLAVEGSNISRITSQAGTPASTPTYVGELNVDTSVAKAYIATGTSSSSDWEQIDGGAGGGAGASEEVAQTAHGFVAGNLVRVLSNSVYTKAQADSAANAEVAGVVSEVASSNAFTLLFIGGVSGLSGLTAGTVYFLDPSTAGAYTATEPTTVGQISKPALVATNASNAIFLPLRGTMVGSATSTMAVDLFSGDGSDTTFTLSATPVSENNTWVYVSGVYQQKDTYSVSGTTLTFSTAPPSGTDNVQVITVGSVSIGTASATEAGATLTLATEQASTSGTAIDFTGIPAGTKQIIVGFTGVSTNGTSNILVQLGDSGGFETTGYVSSVAVVTTAAAANAITSSAGMLIYSAAAGNSVHGQLILTLKNAATYDWVCDGSHWGGSTTASITAGQKALSAELTQLRITSVSADTFDAGSINISYK